ncbi:hypothetical protein Csa_018398 [Cucumis sativus]|uniref:Uncharacterized protein n=1 Tax=Cucumis sativus TaxID=3659 RepID=A0A0A0KLA5_CUCSA|nr:hypothetical protein Csa_018398 [Cucumis sativus]
MLEVANCRHRDGTLEVPSCQHATSVSIARVGRNAFLTPSRCRVGNDFLDALLSTFFLTTQCISGEPFPKLFVIYTDTFLHMETLEFL